MKGSSFSLLAFHPDRPAVGPTDLVDVKKAEAEPFYIVDISGRHAVEFFEEVVLVFLADAGALVSDIHIKLIAFSPAANGDFRVVATVLYRVI